MVRSVRFSKSHERTRESEDFGLGFKIENVSFISSGKYDGVCTRR